MTPAIKSAQRAKIKFEVHEYAHEPDCRSYGEEAAAMLGVDRSRIFKTLVVSLENGKLAVAVVPVAMQLDLKLFAKAAGCKKVSMADKKVVETATGYVLGGVSPLGQRKKLPTIIDESAAGFETIYVSGGKRGLDMEISPNDLKYLTSGEFRPIGR